MLKPNRFSSLDIYSTQPLRQVGTYYHTQHLYIDYYFIMKTSKQKGTARHSSIAVFRTYYYYHYLLSEFKMILDLEIIHTHTQLKSSSNKDCWAKHSSPLLYSRVSKLTAVKMCRTETTGCARAIPRDTYACEIVT